jgi:hypothetical protein
VAPLVAEPLALPAVASGCAARIPVDLVVSSHLIRKVTEVPVVLPGSSFSLNSSVSLGGSPTENPVIAAGFGRPQRPAS